MSREADFNAWLANHPEHLADPLTRMDELLEYLNRSQARTEDLLEAIALSGGITLGSGGTSLPAVPMNPDSIADIIMGMSAEIPGIVQPMGNINSMVIPGPGTLTFTQTSPPGWVIIYSYQVGFTSDFYSPLLMITSFIVAGQPVLPGIIPLTTSLDIPGSVIQPVHENTDIQIVFLNTSATNATITLMSTVMALEKAFYERFYAPLIRKGYATLDEVVALASS